MFAEKSSSLRASLSEREDNRGVTSFPARRMQMLRLYATLEK